MLYTIIMRGSIIQDVLAGYDCTLYLPPSYNTLRQRYPVVYVLGARELSELAAQYEAADCGTEAILVGIDVQKWERDLSPWEANALSTDSAPFSGKAGHFLYILESQIKTFIDKNYRTRDDVAQTYLIGYSLAGLTTLYALYTTQFALHYASVSGSLWFPKWIDFARQTKVRQLSEQDGIKVYLSLGRTEKDTQNALLATVDERTQETLAILREKVAMLGQKPTDVFFEYNDGGHLTDATERMVRAITHLLSSTR